MLELMAHQRNAVETSRTHPRYALYWEPGVGKTIAILAMVADAIASGFTGRVVVLAPKSILSSAWLNDARHFPAVRSSVVWADTPAKRKKQIAADSHIFITSYEMFKKHAADFISVGVKWLVIDECSKVKNHDTQITKLCIWFAAQMQRVNLLSGTPAPNGAHEYVPQLFILAPTLFHTTNFYRVANHYFSPVKRMIQGKERIIGWSLQAGRKQEFYDKLKQYSWALTREECIELPAEHNIIRKVELSEQEADAYLTMLERLRLELAGETIRVRANAKIMKLRQLCSGLMYADNELKILGASKLDALSDLLDELAHEQVVIWAEFTAEIDAIMALLDARGASAARIDGTVNDPATRTAAINRFQQGKAGGLQYLVCHPAAAGHGVTLTAAANDVYFSLSYSYETHDQARARIYRKGQDRKCVHYYLIAAGTIDEVILRALGGKRDASDAIIEYLGSGKLVLQGGLV